MGLLSWLVAAVFYPHSADTPVQDSAGNDGLAIHLHPLEPVEVRNLMALLGAAGDFEAAHFMVAFGSGALEAVFPPSAMSAMT